jgi:hypothetical protein
MSCPVGLRCVLQSAGYEQKKAAYSCNREANLPEGDENEFELRGIPKIVTGAHSHVGHDRGHQHQSDADAAEHEAEPEQ